VRAEGGDCTDLGLVDHSDIVSAIANGESDRRAFACFDHTNQRGFLKRRDTTGNDGGDKASNGNELLEQSFVSPDL
jgi:hypothetical protein